MSLKGMIRNGTVVKFRDGRLAVALKDINPKDDPNTYKFYGLKALTSAVNIGGIIRLDAYDDNLDAKEAGGLSIHKYDIMAITNDYCCLTENDILWDWKCENIIKEFMQIMFGFLSEDDILWDWKREDVIEVTMEAVEKKFGCKVKIVKEEKENENSKNV